MSNWRFIDAENRVVSRTLPNGIQESVLFETLVGVTPAPYIAPPAPVPAVVSRYQARAALHNAGLLTTVEVLMSNPATPFLARLAWKEVVQFERNSPTILAMATLLPLTDEQLDALFVAAAEIRA